MKPIGFKGILILLAGIIVAFMSYTFGLRAHQAGENRSVAYAQAMLAFAHYKDSTRIESLLLRKCYEAALKETQELRNLQLTLISDNFHSSGNDRDLMEYIKLRDPNLLEIILTRRMPELKSYTTTCP